jgi:hypothetical protein
VVVPTAKPRSGPSPGIIAWRRFAVETIAIIILMMVATTVALRARADAFVGCAVGGLVWTAVRIVWHR